MQLSVKLSRLTAAALIAGTSSAAVGAAFVNLGFDDGTLILDDQGLAFAPFETAMPGWRLGGPNGERYDSGWVMNHKHASTAYWAILWGSPGQYSFEFKGGPSCCYDSDPFHVVDSINQLGDVPADAHYLQLNAFGLDYAPLKELAEFEVYLDNTPIPMFAVGENLYQGDISAFAGQTKELRLVVIPTLYSELSGYHIDNVRFTGVPEPAATAGVFGGALLMLAGLRHQKRRASIANKMAAGGIRPEEANGV